MEVEEEDFSYRLYMTNVAQMISESTAKFGGGSYTRVKWHDLIDTGPKEKPKSESEVIAHISAGLDRLGRA